MLRSDDDASVTNLLILKEGVSPADHHRTQSICFTIPTTHHVVFKHRKCPFTSTASIWLDHGNRPAYRSPILCEYIFVFRDIHFPAHILSASLDPQVDTKATPPRAIWVHPYEDEQYLSEHPEVRQKIEKAMEQQMPESSSEGHGMPSGERRHSFSAASSSTSTRPGAASGLPRPASSGSIAERNTKGKQKRGFFGKMKDKAIGTKEEREAYKREKARVCY